MPHNHPLSPIDRLRRDLPPITATPLSVVDIDRVTEGVALVRRAVADLPCHITYALKASYLSPCVRAVRETGAGASVFSELEYRLALRAGFAPADIVFNGVGRGGDLLSNAVRSGVQVNIESLAELRALLSARRADDPAAAVGLRINCAHRGCDGAPPKYEVLGLSTADLLEALRLVSGSNLRINGIAFHGLANQTDGDRHLARVDALIPVVRGIADDPAVALEFLNVGGGFASRFDITDDAALAAFRGLAQRVHRELSLKTVFELGRFLVGDAESVVCRVVDVRRHPDGQTSVIVDATTNYLIPAPGHRFRVASLETRARQGRTEKEVGFLDRLGSPICRHHAPDIQPGDLLAVLNAGAYTGVMKERFVFPLPTIVATRKGEVVFTLAPGDHRDVAEFHGWDRESDAGNRGDRE